MLWYDAYNGVYTFYNASLTFITTKCVASSSLWQPSLTGNHQGTLISLRSVVLDRKWWKSFKMIPKSFLSLNISSQSPSVCHMWLHYSWRIVPWLRCTQTSGQFAFRHCTDVCVCASVCLCSHKTQSQQELQSAKWQKNNVRMNSVSFPVHFTVCARYYCMCARLGADFMWVACQRWQCWL